jgi:cytidine deaminase
MHTRRSGSVRFLSMEMVDFDSLDSHQQAAVRQVLDLLPNGINAVTGTVIAVVAQTDRDFYLGTTVWLSGTSGAHAESSAITAAVSAGDPAIHSLYLAMRRVDGQDPGYVPPCGACRQFIADLVSFTGRPITLYSFNEKADQIQVLEHAELLPFAFESKTLRRAGEAYRAANVPDGATA